MNGGPSLLVTERASADNRTPGTKEHESVVDASDERDRQRGAAGREGGGAGAGVHRSREFIGCPPLVIDPRAARPVRERAGLGPTVSTGAVDGGSRSAEAPNGGTEHGAKTGPRCGGKFGAGGPSGG